MSKRQQASLFISLESLAPDNHPYRKLEDVISFNELSRPYQDIYSTKRRKEKGVEFGLRALVLQFGESAISGRHSCTDI